MKVKIEFEIKETGKYVSFESEFKEKENMYGEIITFKDKETDSKYAYAVGSMKMYKSIGNVLLAKNIELNWLNVEYKFN